LLKEALRSIEFFLRRRTPSGRRGVAAGHDHTPVVDADALTKAPKMAGARSARRDRSEGWSATNCRVSSSMPARM